MDGGSSYQFNYQLSLIGSPFSFSLSHYYNFYTLKKNEISFSYYGGDGDVIDGSYHMWKKQNHHRSWSHKPVCKSQCGNLNVPYPFGVGVGSGGSINSSTNWFDVKCDTSFNPPKAFIGTTNIQIYDISESQMRIANFIVSECYIRQTGDLPNVTTYMYTILIFKIILKFSQM